MPEPISPRLPPSTPVRRRRRRGVPTALLGGAVLLLSGTLSGCLLPLAVGGVAAGGYAAGQERGLDGTASDGAIRLRINDLWTRADINLLADVDLTIFEGRVLLTGAVPTPTLRDQAVKAAWQAEGVKEVIDEIRIAQKSTFSEAATDNWIQTRLRSQLVLDTGIRSMNYTLETDRGSVYVLGIARSQGEADLVLNYARNTPDVRRVVNYIRIRTGAPGNPQAADPPPAPAGSMPAMTGSPGGMPATTGSAGSMPATTGNASMPPPSAGYATPSGPSGPDGTPSQQVATPTPRQAPIQVVPLK